MFINPKAVVEKMTSLEDDYPEVEDIRDMKKRWYELYDFLMMVESLSAKDFKE